MPGDLTAVGSADERLVGSTILIIDDSDDNRFILGRWLRRRGVKVVHAANGHDGLAAAADRPDAIVLDVRLPDVSGLEVARRLKNDPSTQTVPILIRSAVAVAEAERIEGLDAGAEAYLTEPISESMFVSSLVSLLRFSETQRQLEDALAVDVTGVFDVFLRTGSVTWSPSLERIHRIAPGSFGGTMDDWWDLLHPDDRDARRARFEGIDGARPIATQHRICRGDGTVGHVVVRGAVLADHDGRPVRIRGVVIDVTEREDANAEAARLREIAENTSERLRQALLPPVPTRVGDLSVDVVHQPVAHAERIGGDFHDVIAGDDGVLVTIGDIVGHGYEAASQMATVRAMLRTVYAMVGADPSEILSTANLLFPSVCGGDSSFATVAVAHIDASTGRATMASAGHPEPILHRARAERVHVEPGPPIGVTHSAEYPASIVELEPDAWIAWYTDGAFERRDEILEDTVEALLPQLAPSSTAASLLDTADRRPAADQRNDDDRAVVLIRRAST